MSSGGLEAADEGVPRGQETLGAWIFRLASVFLIGIATLQLAGALGFGSSPFVDWRPTLYVFVLWALGGVDTYRIHKTIAARVTTAR